MLEQFAAASPAIVVILGSVAALLVLCIAMVVSTAVRAAEPKDIPQIVATVCTALRPRRRR